VRPADSAQQHKHNNKHRPTATQEPEEPSKTEQALQQQAMISKLAGI
jgi:hypothetical protein